MWQIDELGAGRSPPEGDMRLSQRVLELETNIAAKNARLAELDKSVAGKTQVSWFVFQCAHSLCMLNGCSFDAFLFS